MPVITENALKTMLSQNNVLPVYILFGDDGYLIDRYVNLIISKTCGKDNDFDLQKFEHDADLQQVFDSVNQFPMTCERRCTVLCDYNFESANEGDIERLEILLSENYEQATLVVRFDSVEFDTKHSAKARKLLSACEKSGGAVVALNHRNAGELSKMLQNGAKKQGKILDTKTADYIVQNCGLDINILVGELEKLIQYVTGDNITKDYVDLVCTKSVDASVYDFAKKVIACDTKGAISMLNDLLYMRIEPMIILHTTASAFIDMARVSAAAKVNVPIKDLGADFSYNPNLTFRLTNASYNLKKISDKQLSLCLAELLNADKLIKSFSYDDKLILEELTIRLIYIIANGDKVDKN